MNNYIEAVDSYTRMTQDLKHPTVKRLAAKHPDAVWNASSYGGLVSGNIELDAYSELGEDISGLPDVNCDGRYYRLQKKLYEKVVQHRGRSIKVELTLNAFQRLTNDEMDLLRSIGKLKTHRSEGTYEALTC